MVLFIFSFKMEAKGNLPLLTVMRLRASSVFVLSSHSHKLMLSYLLTSTLDLIRLRKWTMGCRAYFFDSEKKKVRNYLTIRIFKYDRTNKCLRKWVFSLRKNTEQRLIRKINHCTIHSEWSVAMKVLKQMYTKITVVCHVRRGSICNSHKSRQAEQPSWLRTRSYACYGELSRVPCNQRSQSRQQKQCHHITEWANSDQAHDSHWGQGLQQVIVLNGSIPCILLELSSEQTGPGHL